MTVHLRSPACGRESGGWRGSRAVPIGGVWKAGRGVRNSRAQAQAAERVGACLLVCAPSLCMRNDFATQEQDGSNRQGGFRGAKAAAEHTDLCTQTHPHPHRQHATRTAMQRKLPTCRASTARLSPTQAVVRRRPCSMHSTAVLPLYVMLTPLPLRSASLVRRKVADSAAATSGAAPALLLTLLLLPLPSLLLLLLLLPALLLPSPSCSASSRGILVLRKSDTCILVGGWVVKGG